MTEKVANKRTLFATYFNTAILIFIASLLVSVYSKSTNNGYKTFDTTKQKENVIRHVENTTFKEVEAFNLVEHAKNNTIHLTAEERKGYFIRMNNNDSIIKLFMVEQWSQGQRLKRIEKKVNELN